MNSCKGTNWKRPGFVIDANILIEVDKAGLSEVFSRLPFDFAVPDLITEEVKSHMHPHMHTLFEKGRVKVIICDLLPDFSFDIKLLLEGFSGISVQDASVIVLAERLSYGILTGDKRERKVAKSKGIEVHGFLWLVERMACEFSLLPYETAIEILEAPERMHLPEEEKEALIKKLRRRCR